VEVATSIENAPRWKRRRIPCPAAVNCILKNGELPHPSNYHGCSQAKEELQRKKAQYSSNRTETERNFFSNYIVLGQFLAVDQGGHSGSPASHTAEQS
jgi:hypothetical protein